MLFCVQEMVKRENVNCIAVEWKRGVKTRYAQAANNLRVVAAQVAAMLTFLMVTTTTSAAPGQGHRDLTMLLESKQPCHMLTIHHPHRTTTTRLLAGST